MIIVYKRYMPKTIKALAEQKLTVMRIRKNYAAPYRKCKYFAVSRKVLRSLKDFREYIKKVARTWPQSSYYLKLQDGKIFARMDVANGRLKKLYKTSPVTGKVYPIWDYIKK